MSSYDNCSECRAPLQHLIVGGVGDWYSRTLCTECEHIREGVPEVDIAKLLVRQAEMQGFAFELAQMLRLMREEEAHYQEYMAAQSPVHRVEGVLL